MRDSGVLDERAALTDADHVCWVYDDPASFASTAQRYLAVGLRKGERLLCVDHGMAADPRAAGEPFGSVDAPSAGGALDADAVADVTAVLDLSRLETVDVAGCRAPSAWARALAGRGVRLRIQGAPRSVVRIWRLLGMDGIASVSFAGVVP